MNPDPRRLEPYGAPVVLLSADPTLLELVDLAFADHAPLSWATTEQQLLDLLLTEPVAAAEDDMRPTVLDQHLRDLTARLDRLGLAQLERGAEASYRLVWQRGDCTA